MLFAIIATSADVSSIGPRQRNTRALTLARARRIQAGMAVPIQPSVWVVDDSPLDAERARRVLTRNCAVEVFHDGSAALERLSSSALPDVMVLDWVMPGVSGVEVCRFLRTQPSGSEGMGILLLTSHRDTTQIVEGLSAGANDYLAKPYSDEELSARVASLVRSRQLLRRAEQAEAVNRRLLETAPDPFLVIDAEGNLSFANEEAASILGIKAEALVGRSSLELIPGLDLHVPEARESRLPTADLEIHGRRFSPTLRSLSDDPSASLIMSLRDVTERRMLDERRLDFYSIIAHDLRNPLNVISMRLQRMLMNEEKENRGPEMRGDIEKLQKTVGSLGAMINDFLELASLEGASYRIARTEVDLSALVEHARDELRPLLESRSQVFRGPNVAGDSETRVYGDAQRLSQVLSNLLGNAIKFTPIGGDITAHLSSTPEYVELGIEDTGCGIAPEVIPTLFQRYRRGEHHASGTGLGLLIVREIVEAHGGTAGVVSTPEQGSRFWVRLPRMRRIAP